MSTNKVIHLYPYTTSKCLRIATYTLPDAAVNITDVFHIPEDKCEEFEGLMLQWAHEIEQTGGKTPDAKSYDCQVRIKDCTVCISCNTGEIADLVHKTKMMVASKELHIQ